MLIRNVLSEINRAMLNLKCWVKIAEASTSLRAFCHFLFSTRILQFENCESFCLSLNRVYLKSLVASCNQSIEITLRNHNDFLIISEARLTDTCLPRGKRQLGGQRGNAFAFIVSLSGKQFRLISKYAHAQSSGRKSWNIVHLCKCNCCTDIVV